MSERLRNTGGIILLISALMLCLIPVLHSGNCKSFRYRSGDRQNSGIPSIETERNGTVCVNTADTEELTELPGIGDTLAALIVAERAQKGPYYYAEDLEAVKGIGPRTLERFRNMIDLIQGESRE